MSFCIWVVLSVFVSSSFAAPILDDCAKMFRKVLKIATVVDIQDFEHLVSFKELKTVEKNTGSYNNSSYFIQATNKDKNEEIHYVLKIKRKTPWQESQKAYPTLITSENDLTMKYLFETYDSEKKLVPNMLFIEKDAALNEENGKKFLNKIKYKIHSINKKNTIEFKNAEGYSVSQVDKKYVPLELELGKSFKDLNPSAQENLVFNCIALLNPDCMNTGNILVDSNMNARFIDGEMLFSKMDTFEDHLDRIMRKFKEMELSILKDFKKENHIQFCNKIENYIQTIKNQNEVSGTKLSEFLMRENDRNKKLGKPALTVDKLLIGARFLSDLCSK